MTALLPDPVPLDPPPGNPGALADLVARLVAAGDLLGALGADVPGDLAAASSWTGEDADAAAGRVRRVGALARDAGEALVRAGARVSRHQRLLEDARDDLSVLRRAQEDDFGAAALRIGGVVDPAAGGADPIAELERAEAARRAAATTIRAEVADDAAATAAVLAACSAVAGGSGAAGDRARVEDHLQGLLPGWHELLLWQRGREFAAELRSAGNGSDLETDAAVEQAARELLPWAGSGAAAAAALTALGADGLRELLRRLGEGSLSAGSALARVTSALLGAPVPAGQLAEVAAVRGARHVGTDHRDPDDDLVALGMGVVLAAGRRDGRTGPSPSTVREWGRQIIARERALGSGWIVDRRGRVPERPGDPLEEVLDRLAEADGREQAAQLLDGQPTWSHLLSRTWDDGGAVLAAVVARAAEQPGGDVVVRSGLRALAAGLGEDGDPARWTVDRATATAVAPALAAAVAVRPEVVVEPLSRAAAGHGEQEQLVLRGLGYLSADPGAGDVLARAVDEGVSGSPPRSGDPDAEPAAVAVPAGYLAVRDYGQRLAHALDEFAAQERADQRKRVTDAIKEVGGHLPRVANVVPPAVAVLAVLADLDGTWDAAPGGGASLPGEGVAEAVGGAPDAATAFRHVAGVLGEPTAPEPPPIDWVGLVSDLVPGGGRAVEVSTRVSELVTETIED